jgi:type II secretory pathway predicted ATPase ExeA
MTNHLQRDQAHAENPPEGVRLEAASVAALLKVSMTDIADATALGRTTVFEALTANRWPKRTDRAVICQQIEALLEQAGATPDQLATLWHAHTKRRRMAAAEAGVDTYGRPIDANGTRVVPTTPPQETDVLLAKQTLTAAARKAFELVANPFDGEVESADQMFTTGEIRFVREACWQAAVNARFVGVTGESGAGKTTVLADLKERITTDRKNAIVIEPSVLGMEDNDAKGKTLKSADILTAIVLTINPLATVAQTLEKRTRQVERLLADSTTAGNTHLLLIEEAHSLPISTLKHLKRLHERMRLNGRKPMLGILLLGQPELRAKLDDKRHDVREVVQRIEMVELQPLGNDLKPYLQHRAKQASRELGTLMDDGAVEAIRERLTVLRQGVRNASVSLLYPLAVNNTVTAALNLAAALGVPTVTRDVVRGI